MRIKFYIRNFILSLVALCSIQALTLNKPPLLRGSPVSDYIVYWFSKPGFIDINPDTYLDDDIIPKSISDPDLSMVQILKDNLSDSTLYFRPAQPDSGNQQEKLTLKFKWKFPFANQEKSIDVTENEGDSLVLGNLIKIKFNDFFKSYGEGKDAGYDYSQNTMRNNWNHRLIPAHAILALDNTLVNSYTVQTEQYVGRQLYYNRNDRIRSGFNDTHRRWSEGSLNFKCPLAPLVNGKDNSNEPNSVFMKTFLEAYWQVKNGGDVIQSYDKIYNQGCDASVSKFIQSYSIKNSSDSSYSDSCSGDFCRKKMFFSFLDQLWGTSYAKQHQRALNEIARIQNDFSKEWGFIPVLRLKSKNLSTGAIDYQDSNQISQPAALFPNDIEENTIVFDVGASPRHSGISNSDQNEYIHSISKWLYFRDDLDRLAHRTQSEFNKIFVIARAAHQCAKDTKCLELLRANGFRIELVEP